MQSLRRFIYMISSVNRSDVFRTVLLKHKWQRNCFTLLTISADLVRTYERSNLGASMLTNLWNKNSNKIYTYSSSFKIMKGVQESFDFQKLCVISRNSMRETIGKCVDIKEPKLDCLCFGPNPDLVLLVGVILFCKV